MPIPIYLSRVTAGLLGAPHFKVLGDQAHLNVHMHHWRMRGVEEQERCCHFSNNAHAILPHEAMSKAGSCSAPALCYAQQIAAVGMKAWGGSVSTKLGMP